MIAAAYLAKAGYRCLLLEGRPIVGGGVKTAQLTLKGFKDDVCSTAHTFLLDNPMIKNDELKLGDQVLVKVLSIEGNKIRLSRKALIREAREKQQKAAAGGGHNPGSSGSEGGSSGDSGHQ